MEIIMVLKCYLVLQALSAADETSSSSSASTEENSSAEKLSSLELAKLAIDSSLHS
jgi:hypothetical protein